MRDGSTFRILRTRPPRLLRLPRGSPRNTLMPRHTSKNKPVLTLGTLSAGPTLQGKDSTPRLAGPPSSPMLRPHPSSTPTALGAPFVQVSTIERKRSRGDRYFPEPLVPYGSVTVRKGSVTARKVAADL